MTSKSGPGDRNTGKRLDGIRAYVKEVGSVGPASALMGILAMVVGLVLMVTVSEAKTFGLAIMILGAVVVSLTGIAAWRAVTESVTGRRGRYSANTLLMIISFLLLIGVLNFVFWDNPNRWDVTSTRQFTLAPRTLDVLANLETPVNAIAFFDRNDEDQRPYLDDVDNLLREFSVRSNQFAYEVMDPDVEPNIAKQYGVTSPGQVAFFVNDSDTFDVAFGARYRGRNPRTGDAIFDVNPSLEQDFVTPLLIVSGQEKKTAYFLTGHGERDVVDPTSDDGIFTAVNALTKENFDVRPLDLSRKKIVPRRTGDQPLEEDQVAPSLIIIAGPVKDLLDDEVDELTDFLEDGGRLLVLIDPGAPTSYIDFLSNWGVTVSRGNVIDEEDFLRPDTRVPFVTQHNTQNDITRGIERTYFPGVAAIQFDMQSMPPVVVGGQILPQQNVIEISRTSSGSWLVDDLTRSTPNADLDTQGTFSTVVLVEDAFAPLDKSPKFIDPASAIPASLVIIGDSDFVTNKHFDNASNGDLFLNSINYLTGDVSLINIRPKQVTRREILATPNEFDVIRYTSWFVLPSLMALAGIGIWWVRR
jgi:ABC-type uncharacterized transport system involved in gliding motility auxiliary subunit